MGNMDSTTNQKIKVCAYCRVSTDTKDQENSYGNQKSYFEREIGKHENFELYNVYADKGISATSYHKRDDFLQMIYDAGLDIHEYRGKINFHLNEEGRLPKFNRIIVKNSSRFSRNIEVVPLIRTLKDNKVYIDFLDLDLTTESDNYEFMLNLFLNFDQQDSIDKSTKVRFGHNEGAKKGNIHTNTRIYGYDYNIETKRLLIKEDEAEVIRTIYDLYVNEGLGIRRIIDYLDKPENNYKTRDGKDFAKTTILRILSNEKYCGDLVRNKYDTGVVFHKNKYPKIRPKDEWIIHKNKIPAIVSRETFEKAQKIRESRARNQKGIYHGKSEFAGLIKCGKCGASYTRNNDRGKVFFNCSTKKTKGTKACDNVNVYEEHLEAILYQLSKGVLFDTFAQNKDIQIEQMKEIRENLLTSIDQEKSDEIMEKKNELTKFESQKSKLLDLYLDDNFSKKELHEKTKAVEEKIDNVNLQIKNLSRGHDEIIEDIDNLNESIENIGGAEIKKVYTREEVIENLKGIKVEGKYDNGDPHLTLQFKIFDIISKYIGKYEEYKEEYREDRMKLPFYD
jgi:site-specific DNA recombinase